MRSFRDEKIKLETKGMDMNTTMSTEIIKAEGRTAKRTGSS